MTKEPEPAWLLAKVDQRLALMKEALGELGIRRLKSYTGVIITPVSEPAEDASLAEYERWEHSCDNCGKYCPDSMWTGTVERELSGARVYISFGACPTCAGKEE